MAALCMKDPEEEEEEGGEDEDGLMVRNPHPEKGLFPLGMALKGLLVLPRLSCGRCWAARTPRSLQPRYGMGSGGIRRDPEDTELVWDAARSTLAWWKVLEAAPSPVHSLLEWIRTGPSRSWSSGARGGSGAREHRGLAAGAGGSVPGRHRRHQPRAAPAPLPERPQGEPRGSRGRGLIPAGITPQAPTPAASPLWGWPGLFLPCSPSMAASDPFLLSFPPGFLLPWVIPWDTGSGDGIEPLCVPLRHWRPCWKASGRGNASRRRKFPLWWRWERLRVPPRRLLPTQRRLRGRVQPHPSGPSIPRSCGAASTNTSSWLSRPSAAGTRPRPPSATGRQRYGTGAAGIPPGLGFPGECRRGFCSLRFAPAEV